MGSDRAFALIVQAASLSLVLLGSATARADATASERATARKRMDDGYQRRARGDLEGALADFLAADAIMHVTTTGLDVARTLGDLGRLREARARALEVTRLPPLAREPLPLRAARLQASALVVSLESRIPRVRIRVDGEEAYQHWTLDGQDIPIAALAQPIMVDPGDHQIRLDRGAEHFSFDVHVVEGELRDVQAPVAEPQTVADRRPASPVRAEPAALPLPPASVVQPSRLGSGVMLSGFVTAGAAFGIGAVTGGLALRDAAEGRSGCVGGRCPPSTWSNLDRAQTLADVSTVCRGRGRAAAPLARAASRDEQCRAQLVTFDSRERERVSAYRFEEVGSTSARYPTRLQRWRRCRCGAQERQLRSVERILR